MLFISSTLGRFCDNFLFFLIVSYMRGLLMHCLSQYLTCSSFPQRWEDCAILGLISKAFSRCSGSQASISPRSGCCLTRMSFSSPCFSICLSEWREDQSRAVSCKLRRTRLLLWRQCVLTRECEVAPDDPCCRSGFYCRPAAPRPATLTLACLSLATYCFLVFRSWIFVFAGLAWDDGCLI